MTSDQFDERIRNRMETALQRVCQGRADGQKHDFRRLLAERIMRAAAEGKTSLGQLVEAAERGVIQIGPGRKSA